MPSCMQPVCQVAGELHAVRPLGTYGVLPRPLAHAAVRHEHRPAFGCPLDHMQPVGVQPADVQLRAQLAGPWPVYMAVPALLTVRQ